MADGIVDKVEGRLTGVDHEAYMLEPSATYGFYYEAWYIPSVNFIDLARAARSLPETTTSQPFAPDSITNRRTP